MAYALIASESKASTDTQDVTTDPITTTGATLLVAAIASYHDTGEPIHLGVTTIQDSKSNVWTPATVYIDSTVRLRGFYVENPPGAKLGTGHTFTTVGTNNYPALCVAAFSGAKLSAVFDQENGDAQFSPGTTTFQAGSVTPSEANELVIAGAFFNPAQTVSGIDGGFTLLEQGGNSGTSFGGALAYLIQTTATAANPTWTFSGSVYCAANLMTFKAAAAVDTTPPVLSAGSPSGALASGTTSTTLSVTTDEAATAKWGIVASTAYASIANTFSTTGGTSHSTTMSGLTDGTSYTVYVRAQDTAGNPTLSDYTISFSVASASGVVTFTDLLDLRDQLMRADARVTVLLAKPGATSSATAGVYLVKDPDPGDTAVTGATTPGNAKGGSAGGYVWKEYSYDDLVTAYGLVGVPGGGGGGGDAENIITASTWRFDGNSGMVLVSSGFPLQPGQVLAATLPQVRVYVAGVEKAVALHPLDGKHPDGSYRSIGIQFSHNLTDDTPVDAEVHVNTGTGRGTTDLTWTEPTAVTVTNRAVIAPTDPEHLCATFVTLCPLTPAVNDTGLAAAWTTYAANRWGDSGVATGATPGAASYDFCNGLLSMYCRTGTRSWYEYWYNWAMSFPADPDSGIVDNDFTDLHLLVPYGIGDAASQAFGCPENTVINPEGLIGTNGSCGGATEPYSLRTFSLASAYWMGAWRQHKRNLVRTVNNATGYIESGYATAKFNWMTGFGHRFNFGVLLDSILTGYLTECTTKVATNSGLEGPDTWDYATILPWTIDAIEDTIYQEYSGLDVVGQDRRSYAIPVPGDADTGISTFMISLIPVAYLTMYYDLVYPDARIPTMLEQIAAYSISQYRQSVNGDTDYPDSWVATYRNARPAAVADPYFTGTVSTANNRLTWVSGTVVPDDFRDPGQPIQRVSGTGNWSIQKPNTSAFSGPAGADPSSSTYWVMDRNATVSGTINCMIPLPGWYLGMSVLLFAWLYTHTGNSLYSTWRDRVAKTANIKSQEDGGSLGYQTKIWGEYFGGTHQSWLYYAHGGTIRGTTGVHPTVITNPPLQPTLG